MEDGLARTPARLTEPGLDLAGSFARILAGGGRADSAADWRCFSPDSACLRSMRMFYSNHKFHTVRARKLFAEEHRCQRKEKCGGSNLVIEPIIVEN